MIAVKKICKRYGALEVLKDLELEVQDGETLVILGRSGVGKSVLLKQILGIEKPDSGEIFIDGKDLNGVSKKERFELCKRMGMLFQGGALFDSMTVGENVAFYLREHRRDMREKAIRRQVQEALEMVDLSGTEMKMPSDLSGGMRKRAALARLIVYRPQIILYDEPTTGLDPITSMQINRSIIEIQSQLKGTSIVVTHDIKSAMEVGNRIAFHDDKKIAHIAPKNEFLKIRDPQVLAFFSNATISDEYLKEISKGRG